MRDIEKIQWPGWKTVRVIGQGSYGAVYEIERDLFGQTEKAALKHIGIPQNPSDIDEMYNDGFDEESITATFQNHLKCIVEEYSIMRKLNGAANVVNCDDVRYIQRDDGIGWDIFIKMELLTPLAKALPDPIPVETTVKVGEDICRALILCRRFDIIHRDIKPQNIFVSPLGDYKLGDFGIAKTVEKTMGGTKTGTYKYMAPEVYNNQPYGQQVDIYSLGLVLYWMLNKRRMPFMPLPPEKLTAGMDEQTRSRRLAGEPLPPPADGSAELKRIVLKACAFDQRERYRTAEEMLEDLENLSHAASEQVSDPIFSRLAEKAVSIQTASVSNDQTESETAGKISFYADDHTTSGRTDERGADKEDAVGDPFTRAHRKTVAESVDEELTVGGLQIPADDAVSHTGQSDPEETTGGKREEGREKKRPERPDGSDQKKKAWIPLAAIGIAAIIALLIWRPWKKPASLTYEFVISKCTWREAQADAVAKGGRLAVFEDKETFEEITRQAEQNGYQNVFFRVGGRRDPDGRSYYWVDRADAFFGACLNTDDAWCSSIWLTGEPNYEWKSKAEEYLEIYYSKADARWVMCDIKNVMTYPSDPKCCGYIIEYEP